MFKKNIDIVFVLCLAVGCLVTAFLVYEIFMPLNFTAEQHTAVFAIGVCEYALFKCCLWLGERFKKE